MGSSPCRARRDGDGCAGQVGWTRVPELGTSGRTWSSAGAPVAGTTTGGCTPRVGELPPGMVPPDAAGAGRRPAVAHQVPRPDSWIGGVRCRPRCDLMDGCPRVKDSRRRICSLPACKSFSECKSWHAHQGVADRPSHFVGAAELVARGLLGRQRKAPHVTAATRVGAGGAAATVGVVATALARIGGGKLASSPTSQDFVNFEWLTREPSLSPLRAERSRPKRRRFVGVSGRTFPRRP